MTVQEAIAHTRLLILDCYLSMNREWMDRWLQNPISRRTGKVNNVALFVAWRGRALADLLTLGEDAPCMRNLRKVL